MSEKCVQSNVCYYDGANPFGFTPEFATVSVHGIDMQGVVCPACNRVLQKKKHPNSTRFFMIPAHNKAQVSK